MIPFRLAREYTYQLHHAGEHERLAKALANIPVFMVLYEGETHFDVLRMWVELGSAYDLEAAYRHGLEHWRSENEQEQKLKVLERVAELLASVGCWQGAMELEQERLEQAVKSGDRREEAGARRSLGWLLQLRAEYDASFDELTRAYDLYAELDDRSGVSVAIGNMGNVFSDRGEYDKAIECYREQEMICRELGDRKGLSMAICSMGIVYTYRGDYDTALECYRQTETICRELGDRSGLSVAIGNMGNVYFSRGKYEQMLECCQQQETICRELGDRKGLSLAIGNMGIMYHSRREYEQALKCYQQQETICRELGDRKGLSVAIGRMGIMHHSRGEDEQALECLHRAADEHRALGVRDVLGEWLGTIAQVLVQLATNKGAMPEYLATYVPGITDEQWQAVSLQQARENAEESVAIAEELSKPDGVLRGKIVLARITAAEGEPKVAVNCLEAMLSKASDDDQRAELHYWLWKLTARTNGQIHATTPDRDHYHREALLFYERLLEKTPKHEYRQRIEELRQVDP